MKISMFAALAVALIALSGCAVLEAPYGGCGYRGCSPQQREHGSVAAVKQHYQAVDAVMAPGAMPAHLGNCDNQDSGVVYSATNGNYNVQSYGGQTCKGGPTRRAGVERPVGLDGISLEECVGINFSAPQCAKYGRPVAAGGSR